MRNESGLPPGGRSRAGWNLSSPTAWVPRTTRPMHAQSGPGVTSMGRDSSVCGVGVALALSICLPLVSGCAHGKSTPLVGAAGLSDASATLSGQAMRNSSSTPTSPTPSLGATVTSAQMADLRAPARVAIYPLPPTVGCSTYMPLTYVAQLYNLVLRGTIASNSDFAQDGITFKFEVFLPGQGMADSAYTFNAKTNVLHRPSGGGTSELTLNVPAQVGTVLAEADHAGCQTAPD